MKPKYILDTKDMSCSECNQASADMTIISCL